MILKHKQLQFSGLKNTSRVVKMYWWLYWFVSKFKLPNVIGYDMFVRNGGVVSYLFQ